MDTRGRPREPFLGRLKWLVAECDRRGLVVDVTLTRGNDRDVAGRSCRTSRRTAGPWRRWSTRCEQHRNWYLDLANERGDVRDDRYVSIEEVREAPRARPAGLDPAGW